MKWIPVLTVAGSLFTPAWLVAGPGVEVIKISFDKKCNVGFDTVRTAKKRDRDVVVWSIETECPATQLLTIKPKNLNPFNGCLGDPATVAIGTPFSIYGTTAGKVRYYAVCTVDWQKPGRHRFRMDVQEVRPEKAEPEDYELALEVLP